MCRGGEGEAVGRLEGWDRHLGCDKEQSRPKRSPAITVINPLRSGAILHTSRGLSVLLMRQLAISSETWAGQARAGKKKREK